ncbi:type II secretion system protein [Sulfurimonas sp. HSL-1656]|uniref:type II secretion system protein n=1 Tax=Thiomicrolovo subterrani TaxID=3131934 RepID=UPI0031F8F198
MMHKRAFTMMELIFVIVIMGVLAKFGVDIMQQIYNNFVYSQRTNVLQAQSEAAVNQIANRLQNRIKDSVIASTLNHGAYQPLGSNTAAGSTVLEWVGIDYDGWQSLPPLWSGTIDLTDSNGTNLKSPRTSSRSGFYNGGTAAVYFLGSNVDVLSGFGWQAAAFADQSHTMHPVNVGAGQLTPAVGSFSGRDVYEFYQLANSAFAVELNGRILTLYTDYQPWDGEIYTAGTASILMENVTTFTFTKVGDIIKLQVCIGDNDLTGEGEYSLCKERTVF